MSLLIEYWNYYWAFLQQLLSGLHMPPAMEQWVAGVITFALVSLVLRLLKAIFSGLTGRHSQSSAQGNSYYNQTGQNRRDHSWDQMQQNQRQQARWVQQNNQRMQQQAQQQAQRMQQQAQQAMRHHRH